MRRKLQLIAALFIVAAGLVIALEATAQEDGYWNKFKSVFVDWDDDAPAGSAKTTVSGVRGLEMQKELGTKEYDWEAVRYMEDYPVTLTEAEKFLSEGQLGPFQAK